MEVQKTPEVLVRELKEPPLSNLISHYYVKPVNFDQSPFQNPFEKQGPKQFQKGAPTTGYKKPYYKPTQQEDDGRGF